MTAPEVKQFGIEIPELTAVTKRLNAGKEGPSYSRITKQRNSSPYRWQSRCGP